VYAQQVAYWANGQEKSASYGNGVNETTTISGSQITGRKATKGASPVLWEMGLTYAPPPNNNGNPATHTVQLGSAAAITQTYGYDALNRLQSVADGQAGTQTYAYDRWGNRALVTGSYQSVEYPVMPAMVANAGEVAAKFPGNRMQGESYL